MSLDDFIKQMKKPSTSFVRKCINQILGSGSIDQFIKTPISSDDFDAIVFQRCGGNASKLENDQELLAKQLKILEENKEIRVEDKYLYVNKKFYDERLKKLDAKLSDNSDN